MEFAIVRKHVLVVVSIERLGKFVLYPTENRDVLLIKLGQRRGGGGGFERDADGVNLIHILEGELWYQCRATRAPFQHSLSDKPRHCFLRRRHTGLEHCR